MKGMVSSRRFHERFNAELHAHANWETCFPQAKAVFVTSRSAKTFLRLLVPLKTTTILFEPHAIRAMVSRRRSHSTSMRSRPYSLRAVSSEKSSVFGWPLWLPRVPWPEPELEHCHLWPWKWPA